MSSDEKILLLLRAEIDGGIYRMKKLGITILSSIITLLAISLLLFVIFDILPGDPALSMLGLDATPEAVIELRQRLGLDLPLPIRYFLWLKNALKGDMGTSYAYALPVSALIKEKLGVSLILGIYAFVLIILFVFTLGFIIHAFPKLRLLRVSRLFNQILMAVPAFFQGILLMMIFGKLMKAVSGTQYIPPNLDLGKSLAFLFWPALALALPKAAMSLRLFDAAVAGERAKDYVRTAYAKGAGHFRVFACHIAKNAASALITFWGMALADLVIGGIVIEQIFSIPGIGRLLISSIAKRDIPLVLAILVLFAAIVIVTNFLSMLINMMIDARVRDNAV